MRETHGTRSNDFVVPFSCSILWVLGWVTACTGTETPVESNTGGSTGQVGGAASGGVTVVTGGTAAGGVATGGLATGGLATGGRSTGGTPSTGGRSSGGTATGGRATGGAATGGSKVCSATASTLKAAADCYGKLVGAALTASRLSESSYTTAAREHNFVTPENEMKWDTIEASRNNFNFSPGDQIVNFASQNGMKVKGHTLVWHSQLPTWVSNLSNASDVSSVMINHIKTVMDHFKGKVVAWDVVNEAWDTPSKKGDGTATLRNDVFYRYLGAGYIDTAFTTARQTDASALLFYNDYSIEGMNDKANAVYNMVRDMLSRGIPIDGVGMQMHVGTPNDTPSAAEVAQNMQRFADLGLEIAISEMDVNCCDGYTADQEATIYHDIVADCVAQPGCSAITFWGIPDKYSWLNSFSESGCNGQSPKPLLWDDNYGKKPAYTAVIKALTGN